MRARRGSRTGTRRSPCALIDVIGDDLYDKRYGEYIQKLRRDAFIKIYEPALASAVDFVLEGLYAQKKISRSEERGYHAAEQPQRRPTTSRAAERDMDEGLPLPGGKKKYYN